MSLPREKSHTSFLEWKFSSAKAKEKAINHMLLTDTEM